MDVLDRPRHSGGWEEIWRSLESVEFFDVERVVEYALLLDNATTAAKVGFYLEQHRDALMIEPADIEVLRHGNATLICIWSVLMSTVSDFVRLTVQRTCPFGWSLMVDDAAPWCPGGPPARTYLLMVLREMPSSRAVARIESPCRRAC